MPRRIAESGTRSVNVIPAEAGCYVRPSGSRNGSPTGRRWHPKTHLTVSNGAWRRGFRSCA
jgi:hypothetical protein